MNGSLRILYLENDLADAALVLETLEAEGIACELRRVEAEAELRAALATGGFDLILADYTLPSFDGMSALQIVRQQTPHLPFIFVSGTLGEEVAIEALKRGATDYVFKRRLSRLAPAIQRAMREAEERAERKRAEESLALTSFALDNVREAAFLVDENARFGYVNEEASRSLGYTREELLGMCVQDVDLDFVGSWPDHWAELKLNRSLTFESRQRAKDGRAFPVEINANYFEYGGKAYNLALVRDISERKEAEELMLEGRIAERTRVAREIHDTLLQSFQALLPLFQAAVYKLPEAAGDARKTLELAIEQASKAMVEGRDAVQGLRMSPVENNELADAIRSVGEELAKVGSRQRSTAFEVLVKGKQRNLQPILRDEVYRITTEALRNAFRHAEAESVKVELYCDESKFRVRVRDDGRGIRPEILAGQAPEGHYGLAGMRERARLAGGTLTIWTEVKKGTEIELTIPASTAFEKSRPSSRYFGERSTANTDVKELIDLE